MLTSHFHLVSRLTYSAFKPSWCRQGKVTFLGAFLKLRKANISFVKCLSVCPSAWNSSSPTERISIKIDVSKIFFRKVVQKIEVLLKSDKNNGYFTWKYFDIYDSISLNSSYNEKHLNYSF